MQLVKPQKTLRAMYLLLRHVTNSLPKHLQCRCQSVQIPQELAQMAWATASCRKRPDEHGHRAWTN